MKLIVLARAKNVLILTSQKAIQRLKPFHRLTRYTAESFATTNTKEHYGKL